jgi:mannose-6-phosphate isomerase-like protein (cupin superfamily)
MAVFQSGAVLSDAPGFHYHNHAHDVFLVTKGYLKLWNGDKCRIMGPGDFAYVPPVRFFFLLFTTYEPTVLTMCQGNRSQPRTPRPSHRNLRPNHSR